MNKVKESHPVERMALLFYLFLGLISKFALSNASTG